MKKYIYIILCIYACWLCTTTQAQTAADVWCEMPKSMQPTIDSIARLDMIDLYRAGMKATAPTLLGDTAQLITMNDTYLLLRTSKASTMQIKCIKHKKKTLYAIVTTVEGPAPNSHIVLYNESWKTIPLKKYLKLPKVEDFVSATDTSTYDKQDIRKSIIIPTIQYIINDSTNDITALPSFMQTLDKESRERITSYIRPNIKLQWNGKKWK